MKMIRGLFVAASALLSVGLASVCVRAEALSISTNSPFLPRAGQGITATTENTPVELRGLMEKDENGVGPIFGFYDTIKKQAVWVKLNEQPKDFPIMVRAYDAANQAVTVDYQNRSLNLRFEAAKIIAAPVMAAAAGPARPMPAPGQPAVGQAPSPEDTRRLEAVAAEVARRRQARQAAQQQQQPPPPPQAMPNMPNRQR